MIGWLVFIWVIDFMVGGSVGWLIGCLLGCLACWFVDLYSKCVLWLVGWLVVVLVG